MSGYPKAWALVDGGLLVTMEPKVAAVWRRQGHLSQELVSFDHGWAGHPPFPPREPMLEVHIEVCPCGTPLYAHPLDPPPHHPPECHYQREEAVPVLFRAVEDEDASARPTPNGDIGGREVAVKAEEAEGWMAIVPLARAMAPPRFERGTSPL